MWIDTHAHLDDERLIGQVEEIISEFIEAGGKGIINPSYDKDSMEASVDLAKRFDLVYATVGMHPHDAKDADESFFDRMKELLEEEKVIGVGEIGLDYHYDHSPRDVQQEIFERQMDLAAQKSLPVAIHSREAHQDTYDILKKYEGRVIGIMHSYSGSWEMAKNYLDLGYYLSFSGPITFKNSRKLPEVAKNAPLDRILVETDSPYLTPVPFRGKTNRPLYVQYVAQKVAEVRDMPVSSLMEAVRENVKVLFPTMTLLD
ncbi:TatD family hydrolase [Alkalibacter rhizosphaerae]|nr:TatD family hydrolase [Alkalibacter rhizosphaerae]